MGGGVPVYKKATFSRALICTLTNTTVNIYKRGLCHLPTFKHLHQISADKLGRDFRSHVVTLPLQERQFGLTAYMVLNGLGEGLDRSVCLA